MIGSLSLARLYSMIIDYYCLALFRKEIFMLHFNPTEKKNKHCLSNKSILNMEGCLGGKMLCYVFLSSCTTLNVKPSRNEWIMLVTKDINEIPMMKRPHCDIYEWLINHRHFDNNFSEITFSIFFSIANSSSNF